uniref:Uncharacterized protein n=1 Tax=Anguilla anguilla TaxID=7936 RepID=A0A0E9TKN5_ANGAN
MPTVPHEDLDGNASQNHFGSRALEPLHIIHHGFYCWFCVTVVSCVVLLA